MTLAPATDALPIVAFDRWRGSDADRAAMADEVRQICHDIGFFLLVDHPIPQPFMDRVFATMRDLFALPPEQKRLIDKRNSRHFRGWEGEGAEYTNNRPDIREQVDLWSEHPAREPDVEPAYLRLLGPNQWYPDEVVPGFRALMTEWFDRMGALADELMQILAVGLGLDADHFDRIFGAERMSLTKLIRYPPTPSGQAGVNAHHDAGFLTILAAGETPGLQVENEAGDWIDVPPTPGAFVINLGEMLQGMSGNYYVATPHRVIAGLFVVAEEVVQVVVRVLERTGLDVAAVSSLFHGSAPGCGVSGFGWSVGRLGEPRASVLGAPYRVSRGFARLLTLFRSSYGQCGNIGPFGSMAMHLGVHRTPRRGTRRRGEASRSSI